MFFKKNIRFKDSIVYEFPYLDNYQQYPALAEKFAENIALIRGEYFTYGGLNSDLLYNAYLYYGYSLKQSAVSENFDRQLELLMPNVWYLNGGPHLLNTPLFFNRVQLGKENQVRENQEFAKEIGYFGMLEAFNRQGLLQRFEEENIKAFSVIRTLPECSRVLESDMYEDILKGGYENKRYRRLISDIPAAMYYYFLMAQNRHLIKNYDQNNFFIGMAKAQKIVESEGSTPVRRYFVDLWKNVLLNRGIDKDHSEIIVTGTRFSYNRFPDLVIIGQHEKEQIQEKIINSPFAYQKSKKVYVRYQEKDRKFDLIKRSGKKWNWDPEAYLLSLVLLKEGGYLKEYKTGLDIYYYHTLRS